MLGESKKAPAPATTVTDGPATSISNRAVAICAHTLHPHFFLAARCGSCRRFCAGGVRQPASRVTFAPSAQSPEFSVIVVLSRQARDIYAASLYICFAIYIRSSARRISVLASIYSFGPVCEMPTLIVTPFSFSFIR